MAEKVRSLALAKAASAKASDGDLVVAARAGEQWAFEALFRRHARMVNGLAFRILGRADEVDDLAQDAFVTAYSSLDRLQNPDVFSSWLGSIVVRTAHKRLRRRSLRARLGLERGKAIDTELLISPTAPPDVALELRAVYSLLETLPPEERIAIVLRRVEGMKLGEVAERMGLSLATVKRRLARAEQALEQAREAWS